MIPSLLFFLLGLLPATTLPATAAPPDDGRDGRQWADAQFSLIWQQGTEADDVVLYRPLIFEVGPDGDLYVLDAGDQSVSQFSPSGERVQVFGKGQGQGPAEFVNPMDLAVDATGKLWVVDAVASRISVFAQDGTLDSTIPLAGQYLRLGIHPDRTWFALMRATPSARGFFEVRTRDDRSPTPAFGPLVEDPIENSMGIDGYMEASDELIVFAPLRGGRLHAFTWEGEPAYAVDAVEPKPYPKVLRTASGGSYPDPNAPYHALDISLRPASNEIQVTAVVNEGDRAKRALDVYALDTGAYRYSLPLPDDAQGAFATDTHLYVLGDVTLKAFSRN